MNSFLNIDTILEKNKNRLDEIENVYHQSLNEQNIPDSLKVDIMDFLSGLRASLDHAWKKIPGRSATQKNFPKSNSQTHFDNATNGISEEIKTICSKYQEFNDDNWFQQFSNLCNGHKHIDLIPQKRTESKRTTVSKPSLIFFTLA